MRWMLSTPPTSRRSQTTRNTHPQLRSSYRTLASRSRCLRLPAHLQRSYRDNLLWKKTPVYAPIQRRDETKVKMHHVASQKEYVRLAKRRVQGF